MWREAGRHKSWQGREDDMISGRTRLIAHLGYPTETFKAPMIYNPWFEQARHRRRRRADGGHGGATIAAFLRPLFRLTNVHGALVTMPHKVTTPRCSTRSRRGEDRRRVQRDPAAARWVAARRPVRRRWLRPRRRTQGHRFCRRPMPGRSAPAASARRSPPRSLPQGRAASASSIPARRRPRPLPSGCADITRGSAVHRLERPGGL